MGALTRGLRLLNRADPFVEVSVSGSGEHVIAAAGEVHLERCIKDLRERFARVELVVSPPLVAFRETVDAEGGTVDGVKTVPGQSEFVETTTPNGRCTVRVHVTRLPAAVTKVGGFCKHKQSGAVLFFIVKCKSCMELMQCYLQSVVKFSLQSFRKCNT
jgi:ribosome assembly protein 1